jgi:hypothetical protein
VDGDSLIVEKIEELGDVVEYELNGVKAGGVVACGLIEVPKFANEKLNLNK